MYKNILVPMALDHGLSPETLALAQALLAEGGQITALHVHELPNGTVAAYLDEETVQAAFERSKEHMAEKLKGYSNVKPLVLKGHTSRTIVDYANSEGIDCIVIGSHKPDMRDFLLGSTAARVVRHAQCAVHVRR